MAETFERLVSTISDDERKSLLDKMKTEKGEEAGEVVKRKYDAPVSVSERLKQEGLLFRFFLWLESLFKGVSSVELYKEVRINRISRNTQYKYPGLINVKTESVLNPFYEKLSQLKNAADFFKPYILAVDTDPDEYLSYLGNLVLPGVGKLVEEQCNPYLMPLSTVITPDLRSSYLRKLDGIMESISENERSVMYFAVKCEEWLRAFTKINYNAILGKFSSVEGGNFSCKFGSLESDINVLAQVLCNAPDMAEEVVGSLFNFATRNNRTISLDDAVQTESGEYFEKAKNQISMIRMFITTVPLLYLGKIAGCDADWIPKSFGAGEDWFIRYKAQWKLNFDRKWESWTHDCKKEVLRNKFEENFKIEKLPLLPNRPWAEIWDGIPFRYELTAGFLYWFFTNIFKVFDSALKAVMVEGDFSNKDNRLAFQDSYNDIISSFTTLTNLNTRLLSGGELGQSFKNLLTFGKNSVTGKSKASTVIAAVETEVETAIRKFGNACRLIVPIVQGFLVPSDNKKYGSLLNFMSIQGKNNDIFQEKLGFAKKNLELAYEFVSNLEPIDTPSLK